jgi:hypothetical protein
MFWVNSLLKTEYKKIEQLGSGTDFDQVISFKLIQRSTKSNDNGFKQKKLN